MASSFPDLQVLLNEWWGGGVQGGCAWAGGIVTLAANYLVGGNNPPYLVSDFLAFYPKFGANASAVAGVAVNNGGTGYLPGDTVVILQTGAVGATLQVAAVDGSGAVTGFSAIDAPTGSGYALGTGLSTTLGSGTGLTVDITQLSSFTGPIPFAVVQAYVNLANACLQFERWQDLWQIAMGLYVAHFLTLYLRSEGSVGTTAQQIAASGLEKGIKVSEAAGDVSKTQQLLQGMEEWGAFQETTYGMQLATFARGIAPHSIYVY